MNFSSKIIEQAVNEFARFPGIGKKTAMRLVFHLIKRPANELEGLEESIQRIREELVFCSTCGNVSDSETCAICADRSRNHKLICVVEDMRDVMAIENTSQYRGVYHILGGLISPIDGVGPEDLNIDKLEQRIKDQEVDEVIMALSATMEGDTTGFYLSRRLKALGTKVSTLSRGISIGGELEYADEITLGRSIAARVPFD
ncbi:MAG: recombination protein RecR [Bacteroidetes bacterium]|nr:MAG: recombination protein RecR [Bacteroidota bacterium]